MTTVMTTVECSVCFNSLPNQTSCQIEELLFVGSRLSVPWGAVGGHSSFSLSVWKGGAHSPSPELEFALCPRNHVKGNVINSYVFGIEQVLHSDATLKKKKEDKCGLLIYFFR